MVYDKNGLGWSEIMWVSMRDPKIGELLENLCQHGRIHLAVKMARIMIDVR